MSAELTIEIEELINGVAVGDLASNPGLVDFITKLEYALKHWKRWEQYPEYRAGEDL